MHPFFSRPERLFFYLASWLGLALLASFAVSYPDGSLAGSALFIIPVALTFSFVSLSSWFLCRTLPLKDTHPLRLSILILAAAVIGGLILAGLSEGWMLLVGDRVPIGQTTVQASPLLLFTTGIVLYLLSVIFHYLLIAFESSRNAERRSLESEIHARSSELKALRAQIDPHFLFNALNSVAALISTDQQRARTMTVQLAEFFRASVAAGRQHLLPFSEEIRLVNMYLEIEGVRYGKRLKVTVESSENANAVPVPPLILQPLVENAIKHGIAHLVNGGTIIIASRRADDILTVTVRNPVDPDIHTEVSRGTGFGLQAVRDRLRAIAPGKGFLDTQQADGYFEATINLPTDLQ